MWEEEEDKHPCQFRKTVRIDALVGLYAYLLSIDSWYHLPAEEGVVRMA